MISGWRAAARRVRRGLAGVVATAGLATTGLVAFAHPVRAQRPDLDRLALEAGVDRDAPQDLYLEVVIGERATGRIIHVVHDGGRFFVRPADLREVGVVVPAHIPLDPEGRVALDALPGLAYRYEMATQRMILWPPPSLQEITRLGYRPPPPVVATREGGWLATWTGSGDVADDRGAIGGTLLARRFGRWGAVETSFAGLRSDGVGEVRRIESRWSSPARARLWRGAVGVVVGGGVAWTRPVRIGGAGWSRNFGARPDLVTFPIPRLAGDAAVPSAVEVYVDGVERVGAEIDGGSFVVDVLPRIMGAGEAVLRTTDAGGQVRETVVPMYVDASRLAPGLTDFSVQAGVLRAGFAGVADGYGRDAVAIGAIRRGLTESITLEGYGEIGGGVAQGGIGAVWSPESRWGVVSVSGAFAGAALDASAWSLGYQWTGALLGFDLSVRRRGNAFRELADPGPSAGALTGWRREERATIWAVIARGSLSAAAVRWREPTGERRFVHSVDYTRTVGTLTFTGGLLGTTEGATASLSLALPLGPRSHASLRHRQGPGEQTTLAGVRRRVPYEGGWGWEAQGGEDRAGSVARGWLEHRAGGGEARLGLAVRESGATARIEASGSVVAMDGRLFGSRRIHDAFAVVSTSGRAGVPVRFDHRLYGHTNDEGYLLLPDLQGWQDNRIGLDADQLAWGVRTDRPERVAVPADRTGVLLDFGVQDARGALVVLLGPGGEPVAAGTPLAADDGERAVVGLDGEVFLPALPPGRTVVLRGVAGDVPCLFAVRADENAPVRGGYLRPAPVSCEEGR